MNPLPSRRSLLRLLVALSCAAALAACGRKADPTPPPNADPRAPRVYPVDRSQPPEARPRQDELPQAPGPARPGQPPLPGVSAPPPPMAPLEYRP